MERQTAQNIFRLNGMETSLFLCTVHSTHAHLHAHAQADTHTTHIHMQPKKVPSYIMGVTKRG